FITDQDNESAPPVMVIDDVFARTYFPDQDPIGQRVNFIGFYGVQAKIVGVVGHVKQWGLGADPRQAIEAEFFYPFMQLPERLMPLAAGGAAVIVRTQGDPNALIGPVRKLVAEIDPRESVYAVETLNGLLDNALAPQRSTLALLGIFAGLALALAAIGIYAVIAYYVSRRTRELGIRAALGAEGGDIFRLVLGDALRLALWGVGLGLVAAVPLTRLMRGMLYGVGAADPATYAGVAAVLVAVALLAAYVPARRATRLDPLAALRAE
ncbi:MAG: FtsX-like permease family protein, partial [Terriglobales bacterium]